MKITKSVSHPPYNLGYTVNEEAIISSEIAELLIRDERASLLDVKEGSASNTAEKAISKAAQSAEKR